MQWYMSHAEKHARILEKLNTLSDKEIIEYFIFENMKEKHPDFCPLYAENRKCHEMEVLNCYFCACMHFRFSDEGLGENKGKTCYSQCSINAREAQIFETEDAIHLDCSSCILPHRRSVIEKYFSREWKDVMGKTLLKSK